MSGLPMHWVMFSLTAQDAVFTAALGKDREGLETSFYSWAGKPFAMGRSTSKGHSEVEIMVFCPIFSVQFDVFLLVKTNTWEINSQKFSSAQTTSQLNTIPSSSLCHFNLTSVSEFPGTSAGEAQWFARAGEWQWTIQKVALVKTVKGSLQRTPENFIFLLKRAVCNQGQVCSSTQDFLPGLQGRRLGSPQKPRQLGFPRAYFWTTSTSSDMK